MDNTVNRGKTNSEFGLLLVFGTVFLLGAYLTVTAIWLTNTSLSGTTIKFVLIPGTAIGTLLMIIGSLGLGIESFIRNHSPKSELEISYLGAFAVGLAAGSGLGGAIGLLFGALALGMVIGQLFGIALMMGIWLETRRRGS